MKIIITEAQWSRNEKVFSQIEEIKELIRNTFPYYHPCDFKRDDYIDAIKSEIDIEEGMSIDWFSKEDESDVRDFIEKEMAEELLSRWDEHCRGLEKYGALKSLIFKTLDNCFKNLVKIEQLSQTWYVSKSGLEKHNIEKLFHLNNVGNVNVFPPAIDCLMYFGLKKEESLDFIGEYIKEKFQINYTSIHLDY